jgi:three-Cys-motif partner protein
MAKKPQDVRWERLRHTEAKHKILGDYLDAWIPILAQKPGITELVFIDGFAGPGRYSGGEPGSPLLMLDAYLRRGDRSRWGVTAHYFFIEEDPKRAEALRGELGKRKKPADAAWQVIEGKYDDELPTLLAALNAKWKDAERAIFAFVDPFGGTKAELFSQLGQLPQCDLLMFVPLGTFARLIESEDLDVTLDNLYGPADWRTARKQQGIRERMGVLVELLREQLGKSSRWVRAFEITPRARGDSYFLFFGTNSPKGLERMKDAMWKLDPVAGQRFRDSTTVDDPVLFEPKPNLDPLLAALRERFKKRVFTIKEAEDFTLFETAFRHNAHLKGPTLRAAEKRGDLDAVDPPATRKAGTFPDGTRMRFS